MTLREQIRDLLGALTTDVLLTLPTRTASKRSLGYTPVGTIIGPLGQPLVVLKKDEPNARND